MVNPIVILVIGFMAQAFFSARTLVQWALSERAKKVLSPSLFWIFSVLGAYLLCLYGWLRNDFSIVLGQFISYYIYLWNLKMKGIWNNTPFILRFILLLTPIIAICFVASNAGVFVARFLHNEKVPLWLLLFGSAGQVLFTLRFVYQWLYSRKRGESRLPAGFWLISLVGSLSIVSYGIIRLDPVLIVGQSFGLVVYIRNLILLRNESKNLDK
ncbi:MAG: lipid-A-disaccharide synthase N-terminal domain-containing protein [Prevotella sp.]|nr:lipid-A-disaccharide synthase N-terminal domain-containing protein [Prevotella sp.]